MGHGKLTGVFFFGLKCLINVNCYDFLQLYSRTVAKNSKIS